jgi:hypothetical protein
MQTRSIETRERALDSERKPGAAPPVESPLPPSPSPASLLALQRTAGNRATAAMLARQAPVKEAPKARPDDQKLSQLRDISLLAINTY